MTKPGRGMTGPEAQMHHARRHAHEIAVCSAVAKDMIETDDHEYVWFQLVAEETERRGLLSAQELKKNQRWGSQVFLHDDYWKKLGTVRVGKRSRGVNPSNRGVWAPANSTKWFSKPSDAVLTKGKRDLLLRLPFTTEAVAVLRWLDTEIMLSALDRKLQGT